eukprot:6087307-Amphidinium_carterae.1
MLSPSSHSGSDTRSQWSLNMFCCKRFVVEHLLCIWQDLSQMWYVGKCASLSKSLFAPSLLLMK